MARKSSLILLSVLSLTYLSACSEARFASLAQSTVKQDDPPEQTPDPVPDSPDPIPDPAPIPDPVPIPPAPIPDPVPIPPAPIPDPIPNPPAPIPDPVPNPPAPNPDPIPNPPPRPPPAPAPGPEDRPCPTNASTEECVTPYEVIGRIDPYRRYFQIKTIIFNNLAGYEVPGRDFKVWATSGYSTTSKWLQSFKSTSEEVFGVLCKNCAIMSFLPSNGYDRAQVYLEMDGARFRSESIAVCSPNFLYAYAGDCAWNAAHGFRAKFSPLK